MIEVLFTDRAHRTWGDGHVTLPASVGTDEASLQAEVARRLSTSTMTVRPFDVYVWAWAEVA